MNGEDERLLAAGKALLDRDLSGTSRPGEQETTALLAELGTIDADAPVMVSRSIRLDPGEEAEIKAVAAAEGLSTSEWIRRAVRRALAAEHGDLVSAADVIRAIAALPRAS